ncbi:hypothetical protein C8Q73DRAFT_665136 [Cubamyces lactineus]|nr:hypothetical protein C8Q73DRAFT_665136 [Cubamyces lactineus]
MLRKISSTGEGEPPPVLKERLDTFTKKVQSVVDSAKALWARGRIARFVSAAEYTEKVKSWIEELSWHVHSFVEIAGNLQHGFTEMGGRFDKVDEGIVGIRNNIHALRKNDTRRTHQSKVAIPGLRYVPRARFDFGRSGRSACDPGTRKEVLEKIYTWLRPGTQAQEDLPQPFSGINVEWHPDRPILWIHALAGAGKTTLAETIARRDILCIVQNIASDLAEHWSLFRDALLAAVKDNPHIQGASAAQQIKTLLVEPLHVAKAQGEPPKDLIVVIDALDKSMVASFVEDKAVRDPQHQLDIMLHPDLGDSAALRRNATQFVMLDTLYGQAWVKRILGTIALAEERLSTDGLASLLGDASGSVWSIVDPLRSVLAIPFEEEVHRGIRIIHLSFADFLVDQNRCTDKAFYIHSPIQHSLIALRCLTLMQSLKYNICEIDLEHDRVLNSEITDLSAKITRHIPPTLRYACKYWTRHLCYGEIGEDLLMMLEAFCKSHLLHWLEALSLLGFGADLPEGE